MAVTAVLLAAASMPIPIGAAQAKPAPAAPVLLVAAPDTARDVLDAKRAAVEWVRADRSRREAAAIPTPPPPPAPSKPPAPRPVAVTKPATPKLPALPPNASRAQIVISFALSKVGNAYVFGATGPFSYDCSGLTQAAFRLVGVSLPHNADAQINYGRRVSRADLQPGDVVQPNSGHVAIYLGGGRIVHAANPDDGITTDSLYGFQWAVRLV